MDDNEKRTLNDLPEGVLLLFWLMGTPFPRAVLMAASEKLRKLLRKDND